MPPIALLGAGAFVAGGLLSADAKSDAAEKAEAQRQKEIDRAIDLSKTALGQQSSDRRQAVIRAGELSAKSYAEYSAIERQLQTKNQGVAASLSGLNEQIQSIRTSFSQLDPVIQASGEQLVKLIKGEQAEALAPIRAERERQRQQLEGQLAARLGPGYRTSSAGIEALSRFDSQTAVALSDAQGKYIQTLSGTFGQASGTRASLSGINLGGEANDIFRTAAGVDEAVAREESAIQGRQASAYLGALQATPVDYMAPARIAAGTLDSAGTNELRKGAAWGEFFGDISGIGAYGLGQSVFGGSQGGGARTAQSGILATPVTPQPANDTFGSVDEGPYQRYPGTQVA
jgi:hypothetical protein